MSKDINKALQRPIARGVKYDRLMPSAKGTSVNLAIGDTKVAIDNMKFWAEKHYKQTSNIASLLQGRNLENTCNNIHNFLYTHIQYKLDGMEQNLRTPASTWANRYRGTDCKSYTIFGSTILQNLGIPHYLRRIKQSNLSPEAFTHVYIVVPKDSVELANGYYTIDGTVATPQELPFIEADDVYMPAGTGLGTPDMLPKSQRIQAQAQEKLLRYIDYLQKQQPENEDLNHLRLHILALIQQKSEVRFSATATSITLNGKQYDLVKKGMGVAVAIITAVIAVVELLINLYMTFVYDPCANAVYRPDYIQADMSSKFMPKFRELLDDLNKALVYKNHSEIQHRFNYLFKEVHLGVAHYLHELSVHDGNKCSKNALRSVHDTIVGIRDAVDNAYRDFKAQNNQFHFTEYHPMANMGDRTLYFVVPNTRNAISSEYLQIKISDGQEKAIKPVYPYEYDMGKWLRENVFYLRTTYTPQLADSYKKEVEPILSEIRKLRDNLTLYSYERHDYEQQYQADLYKIYLKYDKNYKKELQRDVTIKANANALANVEFKKKLEKLVAEAKAKKKERLENIQIVEEHKQNNKMITLGLLAIGTVAIMKTVKNK